MADQPNDPHADPAPSAAAMRVYELMRQAAASQAAGRSIEAMHALREAIGIIPGHAAATYNLGVTLTYLGRLEEAEEMIRRVPSPASDMPEVRHALSLILLAQGRYLEAWPLFDARLGTVKMQGDLPLRFSFPRWRGEPIAGRRITIFPEQGFGDQIQFARFVPWLQRSGAEVTLLALPPLAKLFQHSFPDITLILASGTTEFPDPDYWITLYDLPGLARATLETLPSQPYLRTPLRWADPPPGFKIGLFTRGNPNYANDRHRSLPAVAAERLRAQLPGTIIDLDDRQTGARDFAETAAAIDRLDLVVSVDSAVGHLAGALGKRCFLLVPAIGTDWRWGYGRDDSPWYPQHRLFRSASDGDWTHAIDRLGAEARALATAMPALP